MSLAITACVCLTVLALAWLVREADLRRRSEREAAIEEDDRLAKIMARVAELERRGESWSATARQVTGILETRKRS